MTSETVQSSEDRASEDRASVMARLQPILDRHPGLCLLGFGFVLFYVAYLVALTLVLSDPNPSALFLGALNNALSALVIAAALMAILRRFVIGRALSLQIGAHLILAPLCALSWYAAVIIGIGLRQGSLGEGFNVNPFPTGALIWQIYQGFFVYVAAASVSYSVSFAQTARRARDEAATLRAAAKVPTPEPALARHLLVKDGVELTKLDVADIVAVLAQDDGVEIVTLARRYSVRMSLAQCVTRLPESFVRIHRSCLINLDRLLAAEPAGDGRLSVHLEGGLTRITSRAGAKQLREQVR